MDAPPVDEARPLLGADGDLERRGEVEIHPQNGRKFVDFDPNGDAENPLEWPEAFKWGIVLLLALMAFTVYVSTTMINNKDYHTYIIGTMPYID